MTKKQTKIITLLSLCVIVLTLLLSARIWFRADLTASKAYTISPVSRDLARNLPDQVQITFFVTDKLRQMYPVPGEIEDLIREYVTYSRGKIRFVVRDPSKAGLEWEMQTLGIPSQQMQLFEKDEATITMVYSGLLIEYQGQTDVIPVIFSIDTLEYDLTSRIRSLVQGVTREAGIIIGDAGRSLEQHYQNLEQVLTLSGYKIRQIPLGREIPDAVNEIFVIGGEEVFDDWALYMIDNFIQRGGKVFFMVKGVDVVTGGGMSARKIENSPLLDMIDFYGVHVETSLVLDRSALTTTFQSAPAPNRPPVIRLIRYPFWVNVTRESAVPDQPLTSGFNGLDMFWPNPLSLYPPDGIEAVPLFGSTKEAWLQTDEFVVNPDQSFAFEREVEETKGTHILAASLSGKFPSYFEGKTKPEQPGSGQVLPDIPAEAKLSRIVVIGNSNFISDEYLQNERNLSFFVHVADWLGNDDDIIVIRNRAPTVGRLDRILDPERKQAATAWVRILNTVIIPVALLVLGMTLAWKRKKRTQRYNKEVSDAV